MRPGRFVRRPCAWALRPALENVCDIRSPGSAFASFFRFLPSLTPPPPHRREKDFHGHALRLHDRRRVPLRPRGRAPQPLHRLFRPVPRPRHVHTPHGTDPARGRAGLRQEEHVLPRGVRGGTDEGRDVGAEGDAIGKEDEEEVEERQEKQMNTNNCAGRAGIVVRPPGVTHGRALGEGNAMEGSGGVRTEDGAGRSGFL